MPSTLAPFPGRPRSEYLSPPSAPKAHIVIEAEGLTADRTRVALAAALDAQP